MSHSAASDSLQHAIHSFWRTVDNPDHPVPFAELDSEPRKQICPRDVWVFLSTAVNDLPHALQLSGLGAVYDFEVHASQTPRDLRETVEGHRCHRSVYGDKHCFEQYQFGGDDFDSQPNYQVNTERHGLAELARMRRRLQGALHVFCFQCLSIKILFEVRCPCKAYLAYAVLLHRRPLQVGGQDQTTGSHDLVQGIHTSLYLLTSHCHREEDTERRRGCVAGVAYLGRNACGLGGHCSRHCAVHSSVHFGYNMQCCHDEHNWQAAF